MLLSVLRAQNKIKKLAPERYQHSEASRADTTNIRSKLHKTRDYKGFFCPFIIAHFARSVKE